MGYDDGKTHSKDGRLMKFCNPCQRSLHRTSLKSHKKSKEHLANIELLLMEDPNWKDNDSDYERDVDDEKIQEDQTFCYPCNKPIMSKNFQRHEDCATHQERAKKYKKKRSKSSDNYSRYSATQVQAPTPPKRTKKSVSEPNIVPASQSDNTEIP